MTIPDCITFLINKLFQILSSSIVFPFVGIWLAVYTIYLLKRLIKVNGRVRL